MSEHVVRRFTAIVNGELFTVEVHVYPELVRDLEAFAKFRARLAGIHAKMLAEDRWGPGTLSGEYPKFTWCPHDHTQVVKESE